MSIPGKSEPRAFSGQQQESINISTIIPIKKRRLPVFQPCSPPREEKSSVMENKEESNIKDRGLSSNDVTKTSTTAVKKEFALTDSPFVQASKPVEAKPGVSLGPLDDLGIQKGFLQYEKSSEPKNPDSSVIAHTADVKREIFSGQTEGTCNKMNVELSLGSKESLVPALEHRESKVFFRNSGTSDSLLSLALHEEKRVLFDKKDSADGNPVRANRSNWDLNTTMDVWEGTTSNDASAQGLVNIGGFSKNDNCHNDKSSLTLSSTAFFGSDRGKHILDGHISNSSKSSTQLYKTDDSLGLKLAMPCMDASSELSSLSDNLDCASVTPTTSLKEAQLPVVIVSGTVKLEPVDDNSKHDCSIGSCSSSNMESLKVSSVKRECFNNHSIETILPSPIRLEKFDDRGPVKAEMVQEGMLGACKSKDANMVSAAIIMQHQDSCASSSALPASLLPHGSSPPRLPTCSELTTNGDFSCRSEHSLHNKLLCNDTAIRIRQDNHQPRPCKINISSVVDQAKSELARIDEQVVEFQNNAVAANVDEKINISNEMYEDESYGSDSESQQNCAVDTTCEKEDDYEGGEVREHVQPSAEGDPIVEGKNTDNFELVKSDSGSLQSSIPLDDQSVSASITREKDDVKKDLTHADPIKDNAGVCYEPNSEPNTLQECNEVSDLVAGEKGSISVPDKQPNLSGEDANGSPKKEASIDIPTGGSHGNGVEIGGEADTKVSGDDDLTLPKVESSPNCEDAAKNSNNAGNKSRIINLSRPSVIAPPFKTKSFSNMLSRSGKERYSDFDGEFQPRGNRDEFYTGGSNKFVKDWIHDQSVRNSRPNFMRGKGRAPGRFGYLRGKCDSDHDFASESSYGPSDYRVIRRKHASSISDVDLERNNGYNIPQDGNALGGNRRKAMNDEFPSLRRTSLRKLSSGDRDGPVTRGFQMLHRVPRNISPRRCSGETVSDMIGLRNDEEFMQQLSDDIINPGYSHPQVMHDELDNQLVHGNRTFSTNLQRKGYRRIHSKSPVRSRTRSPGPWSSPRRRSPNGVSELTQHLSQAMYRMGRTRSPDQSCFHDETVARRRGSPSFVSRPNMQHNNDLRDVDSGIQPRSLDSNRRSSLGRGFLRNSRRANALETREMGGSDEYVNTPSHPNNFYELCGDASSIDDRRKFIDRRGPPRSFQPSYDTYNDNFRFHMNDGPRPYRFCSEVDSEFVDRSNTREREFDRRIKHQPLSVSQRIQNIDEQQQDGNYRPVKRIWHDEGFTDARVKRRRF